MKGFLQGFCTHHWISAHSVLMVLSMSVTSPHLHFTRALECFSLMLNLTQSPYKRDHLSHLDLSFRRKPHWGSNSCPKLLYPLFSKWIWYAWLLNISLFHSPQLLLHLQSRSYMLVLFLSMNYYDCAVYRQGNMWDVTQSKQFWLTNELKLNSLDICL